MASNQNKTYKGKGGGKRTNNNNNNTTKPKNNSSPKPANKSDNKDGAKGNLFRPGSAGKATNYHIVLSQVTDAILLKISEYPGDIKLTLQKVEILDPDTRQWRRVSTDPKLQERHDVELIRRIRIYEDNLVKLHTMIWGRCSEGMRIRLKSKANYDDDLSQCPIKLLQAIRVLAYNPQEAKMRQVVVRMTAAINSSLANNSIMRSLIPTSPDSNLSVMY